MHKESLYNVALEFTRGANILIFADIDAIITNTEWFLKVKEKLKTKDAIQPFKTFKDKNSGMETYSSLAAQDLNEESFAHLSSELPPLLYFEMFKSQNELY